ELGELLGNETRILEEEVQRGEAAWLAAKQEADEATVAADALRGRLDETRAAMHAAEHGREQLQLAHTEAQVSLSRAAAERDRTKERASQVESELRKRKVEAYEHSTNHATARQRLEDSQLV